MEELQYTRILSLKERHTCIDVAEIEKIKNKKMNRSINHINIKQFLWEFNLNRTNNQYIKFDDVKL